MTVDDFKTVGQFLEHKAKIVYPGAYNLRTQTTMWSPCKMRTLDSAKDLNVYQGPLTMPGTILGIWTRTIGTTMDRDQLFGPSSWSWINSSDHRAEVKLF